jgi:hypothetical protein
MALRRTFAALVAAPALVLLTSITGCGGDSSIADPPVRSSPTSSASASNPPAHETAEHFIRRWVAENTRIQRTGDTARFRVMSRGCRGCMRLADLVDRIYQNGGFIHTRGWRVTNIAPAGDHAFDLYVYSAPTTYVKAAGSPPRHLRSGAAHFQLELAERNSWHVSYLVQVSS